MCPFKGEYYFTGIASLCKFKNLIGRRWQCLQKSSHFVSVAWHRSWIEEKVGMKVSIKLHPHQLHIHTPLFVQNMKHFTYLSENKIHLSI